MPTLYAKVNFSIEYIDEMNNPTQSVETGFSSTMPASVIAISRGDASFRLESDSLVSGEATLKRKEKHSKGTTYILDCNGVYKCLIKADYIDGFLDNEASTEIGTISLNDPKSGDRIELVPGTPIRGVSKSSETGPWGRMGAMVTREHLVIDLVTSKTKPKPQST